MANIKSGDNLQQILKDQARINKVLENLKEITTIPEVQQSLPSATSVTNIPLFTAPENGFYFLDASVIFSGSSNGFRIFGISTNLNYDQLPSVPNYPMRITTSSATYLTKGTVITAGVCQNSGTTLTATCRCRYRYILL